MGEDCDTESGKDDAGHAIKTPSMLPPKNPDNIALFRLIQVINTIHLSEEGLRTRQAAIANNEKVFPIFQRRLSDDDEKIFCTTAIKLANWLGSERAYYAEARPKVCVHSAMSFDCCGDRYPLFRL